MFINHWSIIREHKNIYEFEIRANDLLVVAFKNGIKYTIVASDLKSTGYSLIPLPKSIVTNFVLINFATWWFNFISENDRITMRKMKKVRVDFNWWDLVL